MTYKTAKERNIPLLSGYWVYGCMLAKKLLDVDNYLVENLENYAREIEERKDTSHEVRTTIFKRKVLVNYNFFYSMYFYFQLSIVH